MKSITGINTPNVTTNFLPISSTGWELASIAMKASTVIVEGAAVSVEVLVNTTTGYATLMPATNATGKNFIGILAEGIATTDVDYATAGKLKQVWVPTNLASRAKFRVGVGTFTAIDVNKVVSFHTDSASLAVDTQGLGAIITKFVNATTGECSFNVPNTLTA